MTGHVPKLYSHLLCELLQGDMAEQQSDQLLRAMTASKGTKSKAQGTGGSQFDCPTEVSTPHTAIFTFISFLLLSFVDIASSSAGLNQLHQQKISYYATSLMLIIILLNTQLHAHLLNKIYKRLLLGALI